MNESSYRVAFTVADDDDQAATRSLYLWPRYELRPGLRRRGRPNRLNRPDWSKADWALRDGENARRVGCTRSAVAYHRATRGIPTPCVMIPLADRDIDWHQRNADIAMQEGVSQQAVSMARARSGARPNPTALELTVRHIHALDTRGMALSEIARAVGTSNKTAREALRLMRRDAPRVDSRRGKFRRGAWKYDWDAVDWTLNNTVIAEQLGCSAVAVGITRRRQGRPPNPDGRKNPRRKRREEQ